MSEGLLVWGKPAGTGENVVSPMDLACRGLHSHGSRQGAGG